MNSIKNKRIMQINKKLPNKLIIPNNNDKFKIKIYYVISHNMNNDLLLL